MRVWRQSWLDTYPSEDEGVSRNWVDQYTQKWLARDELNLRTQQMEERLNAPGSRFTRIARDSGGTILGLLFGAKDQEKQELQRFYVDKDFHGTGLANALMAEFLDWSDTDRPVEVSVARYTGRARSFYGKYDFTVVDGSEHLFLDKIPCINMIRIPERVENEI